MNSWLSRCSTARGSSSGLSLGGPTKVKASKSFLFTEGSLKVENNERMGRSLVKWSVFFLVNYVLFHRKHNFTLFCI